MTQVRVGDIRVRLHTCGTCCTLHQATAFLCVCWPDTHPVAWARLAAQYYEDSSHHSRPISVMTPAVPPGHCPQVRVSFLPAPVPGRKSPFMLSMVVVDHNRKRICAGEVCEWALAGLALVTHAWTGCNRQAAGHATF